jgi:hypothetical protein
VTPPAPPAPPAITPAPPQGAVLGESETRQSACQEARQVPDHADAEGRRARPGDVPLKGKGATNIRWYVDTRRAGAKRQTWEWTTGNGRHYFIYLWAQQRWGEHLWGRHTIEAKFTVKDSCGKARAVRVTKLYFNHDPLPNDPIFAH